jgi:WhiB family redox-sensing transcriptional regulator
MRYVEYDDLWPERPAWMALANCRGVDPDIFFPSQGEDTQPAKEICKHCEVTEECLAHGLREHFGVWGGLAERQRRRMRRPPRIA